MQALKAKPQTNRGKIAMETTIITARPAADAGTDAPRNLELFARKRDLSPGDSGFAIADYVGKHFFGVESGLRTHAEDRLKGAVVKKASAQRPRSDAIALYRDRDTGLLRIANRTVVFRLHAGLDAAARRKALARHGLILAPGSHSDAPFAVASSADPDCHGDALLRFAQALDAEPEFVFAAPDFVSEFRHAAPGGAAKAGPSLQWHLDLIGAREAWKQTRGRRAITIAILDDGVDIDHPEIEPNLRRNPVRKEPRDLYGRDFSAVPGTADHYDPRPKAFSDPHDNADINDIHGTACAGVAVGTGPTAYGVAPRCRMLPVKIFRGAIRKFEPGFPHTGQLAFNRVVASAIRYAALEARADVLSCSWSISAYPNDPVLYALRDIREEGRRGRGTIVVFASGNESSRKVNFPASDASVIAVGASTDADRVADYSNAGAELCVLAPSSGGTRGIFTTDVTKRGRGYNPKKRTADGTRGPFTDGFSGTSSATPAVAGLCGLLLSLKPQLTAEHVRRILIDTAKKIGPASAYKTNGHSNRYGYGRIDAAKAVAAAQAWAPATKTPAAKTPANKTATKKTTAKRPTSSKKR
jgi:subtilisin family serine protease